VQQNLETTECQWVEFRPINHISVSMRRGHTNRARFRFCCTEHLQWWIESQL
jgi:hypothetical protein